MKVFYLNLIVSIVILNLAAVNVRAEVKPRSLGCIEVLTNAWRKIRGSSPLETEKNLMAADDSQSLWARAFSKYPRRNLYNSDQIEILYIVLDSDKLSDDEKIFLVKERFDFDPKIYGVLNPPREMFLLNETLEVWLAEQVARHFPERLKNPQTFKDVSDLIFEVDRFAKLGDWKRIRFWLSGTLFNENLVLRNSLLTKWFGVVDEDSYDKLLMDGTSLRDRLNGASTYFNKKALLRKAQSADEFRYLVAELAKMGAVLESTDVEGFGGLSPSQVKALNIDLVGLNRFSAAVQLVNEFDYREVFAAQNGTAPFPTEYTERIDQILRRELDAAAGSL